MASRSYSQAPVGWDLPGLALEAWPPTLNTVGVAQMAEVLTPFVLARRWYRSKAKHLQSARIHDILTAPGEEWSIVLLEFEYEECDCEIYLCTVAAAFGEARDRVFGEYPESAIARIALSDGSIGVLYEAIGNRSFSDALLAAVAREVTLEGAAGHLSAWRTKTFQQIVGTHQPILCARVSKAEQSNSSIFYGDRFILKIFRKLDAGINPDFEIGQFLTGRGFRYTPAVAGHIEYREAQSEPMLAGILQQFVPNQGDAWEFTLGSAREFYAKTRNRIAPRLISGHPMEENGPQSAAEARRIIGTYIDSAQLLARRTAEMHIALTDSKGGPEFAPEPFTEEFRIALHGRLIRQMDLSLRLIREKQASLESRVAADAQKLLDLEPRIRERFRQVCENPVHAMRIRHHGDYHLGQVLWTGNDFAIIDFEGEPARSLEERRIKRSAMRDVAGMLRSFQYAAYFALPAEGSAADERRTLETEAWAEYWNASVGRAFLSSYLAVAGGQAFVPDDTRERRLLLDVFVLEKALYEVAYELNNRPHWVRIPLRGILLIS